VKKQIKRFPAKPPTLKPQNAPREEYALVNELTVTEEDRRALLASLGAPAVRGDESPDPGDDYEQKRALFLEAIRFLHKQGGDDAVQLALGDMEMVDAVWREGLDAFREFLRARVRMALAKQGHAGVHRLENSGDASENAA
jgi:hypothetical protein